jgi:hypothetical protein
MDEEQRLEDVQAVHRKAKDDVSALARHLQGRSDDIEYAMRFFREFILVVDSNHAEIFKVFADFFMRHRRPAAVSEVLGRSMEFVERDTGGAVVMLEYYGRLYDENKAVLRESGVLDAFIEAFARMGCVVSGAGAAFESYSACRRICDMIFLKGKPPAPKVSVVYLELLCGLFIRASMFYSFLNAVNLLASLDLEAARRQCSLEELKLIMKYVEFKNEGDALERLFCNARLVSPNLIFKNLEGKLGGGAARKSLGLEEWERVMDSRGRKVEASLDLVAFLLKNDIRHEMEDGMVRIGEYEYRPIERKIFEIVSSYEERVETKEEGRITERVRSVEMTPIKTRKERPKKTVVFADRFSVPYRRLVVYLKYTSATRRLEDRDYEERDSAVRSTFEERQERIERVRNGLSGYRDVVEELRTSLEEKIKARASRRAVEERGAEESRAPRPASFFGDFKQKRISARYVPPTATASSAGRYVPPSVREAKEEDFWGRAERKAAREEEKREKKN